MLTPTAFVVGGLTLPMEVENRTSAGYRRLLWRSWELLREFCGREQLVSPDLVADRPLLANRILVCFIQSEFEHGNLSYKSKHAIWPCRPSSDR